MPDLTPAERRVLLLLMQGLDTDDIAKQCVVAPATVKTHIRNMYQKTGTHSRVALVNWGRRDLGQVIADLNHIAQPIAHTPLGQQSGGIRAKQ